MNWPIGWLRRCRIPVAVAVGLSAGGVGVFHLIKASAERSACQAHLHHIAFSLSAHNTTHGTFPPGTLRGDGLAPGQRVSWVPLILKWTDYYQGIEFLFESDSPWDSPENRRPRMRISPAGAPSYIEASRAPSWFPPRCPANPARVGPGMPDPLHYVGIAGLGVDAPTLPGGHPRAGVFGYDRRTGTSDIVDGLSQTMILAETTDGVGPWTAGGYATVRGLDPSRRPYLGPGRQFGGVHFGGGMIAMADGSVRFLSASVDPRIIEALSTVAGGEPLPDDWDR